MSRELDEWIGAKPDTATPLAVAIYLAVIAAGAILNHVWN